MEIFKLKMRLVFLHMLSRSFLLKTIQLEPFQHKNHASSLKSNALSIFFRLFLVLWSELRKKNCVFNGRARMKNKIISGAKLSNNLSKHLSKKVAFKLSVSLIRHSNCSTTFKAKRAV